MVGDDTQGDIHLVALAVKCSGYLGHLVGDVHNGVDIKQRVNALAHDSKALKSHTGVDILLNKVGVVALAVVIKLAENIVPYLDVSVTVAADGAVGLAAAVLLATVIVYLRAGAARAGAVLPEVILLAEAEDALCGDTDLLVPDLPCLVVIDINGRVQSVGVYADPLGTGEELPAVCNSFLLEIIAEGEVSEHFKISAVSCGLTDILDITGADALLAGADTLAGRYGFALEIGLHGCHAGVYEQKTCVVMRYQREAGQTLVTLAFKKREEHLSKFVKSKCFHLYLLLLYPSEY